MNSSFVPVGVKAEDAPHVVIRDEDSKAEIKPVVGWFGLSSRAVPAVIGAGMACMLDGENWTLHASYAEALRHTKKS